MKKLRFIFLMYLFSLTNVAYALDKCKVIKVTPSTPTNYTGKCINGLANGYGIATHKHIAAKYKGHFKNGKFNGAGTLTIGLTGGTNETLQGNWKNGELNGYGKVNSKDYSYQGQWVNGKRTGQGTEKNYLKGTVFTGLFKNGLGQKGRLTMSDNTYIQGNWINGNLNGYVIETLKNGNSYDTYKGYYRNNKRHGKGVFITTTGKTFTGVWLNGKAHSGDVMKLINKPIPKVSKETSAAPSGGVVESQIDGDFEGWEGESIFKLMNGQIWQQSQYSYTYHYAYMPNVIIYPSNGGYKMKVDGLSSTIFVQRLR